MGCISSKRELDDLCSNIFQVMNIDEHGNHINSGQLEITDVDLVLHQKGKSPVKWPLRTLRRYGFDAEHFSFESGRRCPTGPGIYAFRCNKAEQLFNVLQNQILHSNNGESETTDTSNSIINTDSGYLEPSSVLQSTIEGRISFQNGVIIRLSSIGSTSGSMGPLSPQSITTPPLLLDTVPLIPPSPTNHAVSQNLYANDGVIAAVTEDLEETNNNKTSDDSVSPSIEQPPSNSAVLDALPEEDVNNITNGNCSTPEEVSSPVLDNNHLYMNVVPGTDNVSPSILNFETQSSGNFVTLNWDIQENSLPKCTSFEADVNLAQTITTPAPPNKSLNYIVLDLEPSGDLPKSPTASLQLDILKKPNGGYAAIDFKKTVALSHSVNPTFDTDNESCRKTRHSSNINNLMTHEKHCSSVSD